MGGKSSKDSLERNAPVRQSQAKRFGVIKRKCDAIGKRLKKLQDAGKSVDLKILDGLEKEVLCVQNLLQEISSELKLKYQKTFDDYVSRCDGFIDGINKFRDTESEKVGQEETVDSVSEINYKPIRTPVQAQEEKRDSINSSIQKQEDVNKNQKLSIPTTPFSLNPNNSEDAFDESEPKSPVSEASFKTDSTTLERTKNKLKKTDSDVPKTPGSEASFSFETTATAERKKKKLKKHKNDAFSRKISIEEKSFESIDRIRMEMSDLRDEVLTFKGSKNDQVFHFLKESFLRYITKLEDIDIFDNKQIKYERRLAIAFARDSIKALEELARGVDVNDVRKSLIEHDQLSKIQCVSQGDLLDLQENPAASFQKYNPAEKQGITTSSEDRSEIKTTNSDGETEEVNMRDFKKMLDVKLGRMSRMDVVTINMIKKCNQQQEVVLGGRGVNIDQSDGDSSADDIDDIMHALSDSNECLSPPLRVTSI